MQAQVFNVKDLDSISFECPKCDTEITFRAGTPTTFGAPYCCPTCRAEYLDVSRIFAAYRDFYAQAVASEKNIQLKAKVQ
jgi:hypothetical protein